MIREPDTGDASALCLIYNHFVHDSIVTFATAETSLQDMAAAISAASNRFPWVVWEDEGQVLGYALASEWKSRCAYRFSVETTIYLDPASVGRKFDRWIDVGYWQKVFQ